MGPCCQFGQSGDSWFSDGSHRCGPQKALQALRGQETVPARPSTLSACGLAWEVGSRVRRGLLLPLWPLSEGVAGSVSSAACSRDPTALGKTAPPLQSPQHGILLPLASWTGQGLRHWALGEQDPLALPFSHLGFQPDHP